MTRRRAENWIVWLLPLLMLRLLLPVGVMPAAGPQGTGFVLCTAQFGVNAAAANHTAPIRGSSHADSLCPFAAAAAGAPTPSVRPMAARGVAVILPELSIVAGMPSASGPVRSQTSRAPPQLS